MERKKLKRKDVVFDDDTSDSSSDEEQIEQFKKQLSKASKTGSKLSTQDGSTDEGDLLSEDEDENENENQSSSEDELVDDADTENVVNKLNPEMDAKLAKLKAQLHSIKNLSDNEAEEEDNSSHSASEESEVEDEEQESDKDTLTKQADKKKESTNTAKRKTEELTEEIRPKKIKVDRASTEEEERLAFRSELSAMSIEEIQELKEKLGLKVYNKAIGVEPPRKIKSSRADYKRDNKNRPRETSSKVKVGRHRDVVGFKSGEAKKAPDKRDPRFDALCGDFDEKVFKQSYTFVEDIKSKEREHLKKELDTEKDEERIKQIKYLIQRMDNQEREKTKHAKIKQGLEVERQANKVLIKEGKKPVFISKAERKAKELVEKYEELQQTGKLDHYMKRKQKKNLGKEKKKLPM